MRWTGHVVCMIRMRNAYEIGKVKVVKEGKGKVVPVL
jgi:hypothetical protein